MRTIIQTFENRWYEPYCPGFICGACHRLHCRVNHSLQEQRPSVAHVVIFIVYAQLRRTPDIPV
jgi:hypothetical protein